MKKVTFVKHIKQPLLYVCRYWQIIANSLNPLVLSNSLKFSPLKLVLLLRIIKYVFYKVKNWMQLTLFIKKKNMFYSQDQYFMNLIFTCSEKTYATFKSFLKLSEPLYFHFHFYHPLYGSYNRFLQR